MSDSPKKPQFRLPDTRVIQKNLVYVIGIPIKYSNPSVLSSPEFFGQFGKIKKLVVKGYESTAAVPINTVSKPVSSSSSSLTSSLTSSPTSNSSQNIQVTDSKTISCYITYESPYSAVKCISLLDESLFDQKTIRCTFGTTKYCSFYLKNKICINDECMYLHNHDGEEITQNKGKFKLHNFRPENKGKIMLGKEKIDLKEFFKYKNGRSYRRPEKIENLMGD